MESDTESWFQSTYYVRPLPPTLDIIKWDFDALSESDESEYIHEKIKLIDETFDIIEIGYLSEQVAVAQKLLRKYSKLKLNMPQIDLKLREKCSKSTVSQRDIQRAFMLYDWFMKLFQMFGRHSGFDQSIRAILVAVGIVYYFRLDINLRKQFIEDMPTKRAIGQHGIPVSFLTALNDEIDWFMKELIILPDKIASTEALKENIFATIVCTMTRIPLIIVGPPGSSKTLSFKIVSSSIQDHQRRSPKQEKMFPSIHVHPYQCSRRSTSVEIKKVFDRAITRQKRLENVGTRYCDVILMDEAGLPEKKHESLKILHYYLDHPQVSHFLRAVKHLYSRLHLLP